MLKKSDKKIKEELIKCNEYLQRLRRLSPKNPVTDDTLPLLFAIQNVKTSINIQTVVMTLGFIALGLVIHFN